MTDTLQSPETILVVEDDVLVRMPISRYLREPGYKVIEAANGEEAMSVLLHEDTVIDLIFANRNAGCRGRLRIS